MPYALFSMIWVSVAAMAVTVASGMGFWKIEQPIRNHVLLALTATMLALFAHTMTMFYFIGTGKKAKEFIAEWEEETRQSIRRRIVAAKMKLFPHMTFVCVVIMAAFIFGGAYDSGVLSKPFHMWSAYLALLYHIHVSTLETLYVFKNVELIHDINHMARLRAATSAHTAEPA